MKVEQVLVHEAVRVGRRANSEFSSVLHAEKRGKPSLRLTEGERGVLVATPEGEPITLIPWAQIRQVIYAEPEPAPPKAKP